MYGTSWSLSSSSLTETEDPSEKKKSVEEKKPEDVLYYNEINHSVIVMDLQGVFVLPFVEFHVSCVLDDDLILLWDSSFFQDLGVGGLSRLKVLSSWVVVVEQDRISEWLVHESSSIPLDVMYGEVNSNKE